MKPTVRCSGLDRLLSCFGSRRLEQHLAEHTVDLGDASGDEMTWRGNWCHYAAAQRLVKEHGAVGNPEPPEVPRNWKPDRWVDNTVDWYVSNVVTLTPPDHAIVVERSLTAEFNSYILTGHPDVFTLNPDVTEFTIDDLKAGPFEVDEAAANWQLAGYAVLLKREYPTLQRGRLRIFQRAADEPITEVEVDDLENLAAYLDAKITEAIEHCLLLTTGHKQCRLCPAIFICKALKLEIKRMQALLTEEEVERLPVVPDIKELAAVALDARAILGPAEKLIKALRERIERTGPQQLPDGTILAVREENGRRKVTHPKAAFELVASRVGEDRAWETLDMSLTTVEDELVAAGLPRTSKKTESAQGFVKEAMKHLYVQTKIKKLRVS